MNNKTQLTYRTARYGMSVEVRHIDGSLGYHAGCKIHFFNKKGALVGNYYEFMPYERLFIRAPYKGRDRTYIRFFYPGKYERVKMFLFKPLLRLTGSLIRFTQKYMD